MQFKTTVEFFFEYGQLFLKLTVETFKGSSRKKLLYAFLGGLTRDELEHYISDICQVDCYTNNNSVIVKRIMRMTSQKIGIVKNDYNQINGLIMFAEGDIVKKYTNIEN